MPSMRHRFWVQIVNFSDFGCRQSLTEVKIAVGQNDQNVRFTRLHVLHLFQSVRVRVKNNLSEQSDTQVAISASALKLRDYHSNIRLLLSSYSSNSLSYF